MRMTRFRGTLLILLTTLGLLAPTRGASPRITLRLESAACEEAAQALSRAADVPIQVVPWPRADLPDATDPPLADLSRPRRWEWNNVLLAQAMRDLAEHYTLQLQRRQGGGYLFYQRPLGSVLPKYGQFARTEARGYEIQIRSVTLAGSYPSGAPGERLLLRLHGRALNGDASAVIGVEDVVARDDRGGVLVDDYRSNFPVDPGYPDEWSTSLRLTGLQPGATRLELVEGTLIAAPVARTWRCEFALPGTEKGARKNLGAQTVEFVSLEEPRPVLFVHPSEQQSGGPVLQLRLPHAEALPVPDRRLGSEVVPLLIGASGKTYVPHSNSRSSRALDGNLTYDLILQYPVIDEPVRAVRIDHAQRLQERALGTFRIRNVPLATAAAPRGLNSYLGTLRAGALTRTSLDYAPAGGMVAGPVRIGGKVTPSGRLSWGLSAADGSTRMRWYETELDAHGVGKLTGVRAGRYRVIRVYRPSGLAEARVGGWWQNDECVVQVEPGKEAALPPLQLAEAPPLANPSRLPARAEDLEVRVERLNLSYSRAAELFAAPWMSQDGSLTLSCAGIAGGVETSRIGGLRNVVARDDRGGLLIQRFSGPFEPSGGGNFEGLKWTQSVILTAPHPKARSLTWIEGELMAYGRIEKVDRELPLPLPPEGLRQELGPLTLELDGLEVFRPERLPGQPRPPSQYRLRGRVFGPPGTEMRSADGGAWQPVLVGRSETVYQPVRTFDSTGDGRREFRCRYEASELPVKVRLQFTARTDLEPVGSFRLTGVRLPDPTPYTPRKIPLNVVRNRLRPVAGEARIAALQQEESGADLVLPVRLNGRPAAEGTLQVGLSARTPSGWGPLRWVETALFEGEVRIRDLKPGTYRVLRVFRPDEAAALPVGGRWSGKALQATLLPDKETVLPPLTWQRAGR